MRHLLRASVLSLALAGSVCFSTSILPASAAVTTVQDCLNAGGACKITPGACSTGQTTLGTCSDQSPAGACCSSASTVTSCQGKDATGKAVAGHCAAGCASGETSGGSCTDATNPVCCIAGTSATPPTTGAGSSMTLTDPLGGVGLIGILSRLIKTFLGLTGAIALLVFVYSGVLYMTAGGSETQVTKAKDAMKYAFIGLALIMGAYALTSFYFQALTQSPPTTSTTPTP